MKIVNCTLGIILLLGFVWGCADDHAVNHEDCAAEIAKYIELESMKP